MPSSCNRLAMMARLAGRIALVLGSVLIVLLALELTLRAWPTLLGHAFANGALSRYTSRAGGIYYADRGLRMSFMIPNHSATMLANGYVWRHRTDALGFRNDTLHVPADIMLLGDSIVYGHGVDFEHTIGHALEQRSGLRVVNLGRQGDCAFQEAYLLTAYRPVFKPSVVVHVFSPNDIEDLHALLSDTAMRAFIAQPVDRITFPPRTDPAKLLAERERRLRQRSLITRLDEDTYVMKALRWIPYGYRQGQAAHAAAGPGAYSAGVSVDPTSLGWRYTEHALFYMKHVADEGGARLLTTTIVQGRQREILRDIAVRAGITFIDAAPLFDGPSFLPNDGHLSPHGARVMADLIAAELERRRRGAQAIGIAEPGRFVYW